MEKYALNFSGNAPGYRLPETPGSYDSFGIGDYRKVSRYSSGAPRSYSVGMPKRYSINVFDRKYSRAA